MNIYSLNIARIGRHTPGPGTHDLVNVLVDGHYQRGLSTASLSIDEQGLCHVYVRPGTLVDATPLDELGIRPFMIHSDGTQVYDLDSRQAALDLLRSLYRIEHPKTDPDCRLCEGGGHIDTLTPHAEAVTVACPLCLQREQNATIQRLQYENQRLLRRLAFKAPTSISLFPRSVPAPSARDVDSDHSTQSGTTLRASFLAHNVTYQQHLTARNTQ